MTERESFRSKLGAVAGLILGVAGLAFMFFGFIGPDTTASANELLGGFLAALIGYYIWKSTEDYS